MTSHKATTRRFNFLECKLINSVIILKIDTVSKFSATGHKLFSNSGDVFLEMPFTGKDTQVVWQYHQRGREKNQSRVLNFNSSSINSTRSRFNCTDSLYRFQYLPIRGSPQPPGRARVYFYVCAYCPHVSNSSVFANMH